MAPDTDPSSTLAGILEDIREGAESEITHPDDECGIKAGGSCTPHATILVLAALDAVLKLADELEQVKTGPPSGKEDEGAALGLRWAGVKVREAITSALTGEEADRGH